MAVSDFTQGPLLSVQGVFESPQHEITTKYEFQISQSTKGKFDQSNELAFSASVEILRAPKKKSCRYLKWFGSLTCSS